MLFYYSVLTEHFAADIEKALIQSIITSFPSLKRFGFGYNFLRWVRTIFENSESCVINNGTSTGYFKLKRGTKQGDPLSPYLFVLALQTLFNQVRSNPSIKGFRINNVKIKLTAYADDTTFCERFSFSPNDIKNNEAISGIFVTKD